MKLIAHCSTHPRYHHACGCCHQARIEELEALVVLYRRELSRLSDVVGEEDHESITRLIGEETRKALGAPAPDAAGEAREAGEER